jgi:hypothetical protein
MLNRREIDLCAEKAGVTIDRITMGIHGKVYISQGAKKGLVIVSTTSKNRRRWDNVIRDMKNCLKENNK